PIHPSSRGKGGCLGYCACCACCPAAPAALPILAVLAPGPPPHPPLSMPPRATPRPHPAPTHHPPPTAGAGRNIQALPVKKEVGGCQCVAPQHSNGSNGGQGWHREQWVRYAEAHWSGGSQWASVEESSSGSVLPLGYTTD